MFRFLAISYTHVFERLVRSFPRAHTEFSSGCQSGRSDRIRSLEFRKENSTSVQFRQWIWPSFVRQYLLFYRMTNEIYDDWRLLALSPTDLNTLVAMVPTSGSSMAIRMCPIIGRFNHQCISVCAQ